MVKKTTTQPKIRKRTETPRWSKDDKGNIVFLCPFCKPSHLLIPGKISPCGTQMLLEAVQVIYRAKYSDLVCAKCGNGGGEMVHWQNAFIHIVDCVPGVFTPTEMPKTSRFAQVVYKLPKWAKESIEKRTGQVMIIDEVSPEGKRTGKILGYFFMRGTHA